MFFVPCNFCGMEGNSCCAPKTAAISSNISKARTGRRNAQRDGVRVPSAELRVGESRIRRLRARAGKSETDPGSGTRTGTRLLFLYARQCGPLHGLFPFHPCFFSTRNGG